MGERQRWDSPGTILCVKEPPTIPLSSFSLAIYCCTWGQPLNVVLLECDSLGGDRIFIFNCLSIGDSIHVKDEAPVCFSFRLQNHIWWRTLKSSHLCLSPAVLRWACFLGLLCSLWYIHLFIIGFPEQWGEGFNWDIPSRAEHLKDSHSLHVWLWTSVFFPILCRKKLLWQGSDLRVEQNDIEIDFIFYFYVPLVEQ